MAANEEASFPPLPKPNKRADYYPLWRHVKKISRILGGGSWEWRCTLCNGLYKGSYPRVRAHFLHEIGKGLIVAQKQVIQGKRGSLRMNNKRLIGLKEDMMSLIMPHVKLHPWSQGLCMKQARGRQLKHRDMHQKSLAVLLQFKKAG